MDKNTEKILDTMRKIRTQETIKIIEHKLGDIGAKEDYERLAKTHKINDVKYLGKIEINKEIDGQQVKTLEDLFVLVEQKEILKNGQNQIIEIEKYVTKDLDYIAGNNMSDSYQLPMVTEKYKDQKNMLEKQLEELGSEGILDLNDMENDRLELIAKALGVKVEEIKSIDELDLDQEISKNKEKLENEQEENELGEKDGENTERKGPKEKVKDGRPDKENEQEDEKDQEDEQEELSKKELDGLQIKEETRLSQNIKGVTLEDKLGLKKNGITDGVRLARVTTDSLNPYLEKSSTQVDSFVVIRKNGEAVVLGENILEPDNRLGTNPTGTDTTINNDGSVKQEGITSSYRIVNGNGRDYLRIGYDEVSGKEIKYGMYSPEKNDYVNVELETQRTKIQNSDVRQFMKDRGVGQREAEQIIKKDKEHGECDNKDVTVVDNDKNNDSHTHEKENEQTGELQANEINEEDYIPYTNMKWKDFATLCGYRGEDRMEKAYEKWNNERSKAENAAKDNGKLVEEIQEEINEDYAPGMQRG